MNTYSIIKNNIVINVFVINQKNDEFAQSVCEEMKGDFFIYRDESERQPSAGWVFNSDTQRLEPNKPYESWIFDEDMFFWKSPVSYPTDGKYYIWDEETLSWVEVNG